MTVSTIFQHFYSVFQAKNQELHDKCPLHESRDLYLIQEGNKTQEYAAKWVCDFCGKAFYSEHYLDKHFDNKHTDKLVKVRTQINVSFYWGFLNAFHYFVLKEVVRPFPGELVQGSSKIIEDLCNNLKIKILKLH